MNKIPVACTKCASYDPELLSLKVREAIVLAGGFPKSIRKGARVLLKPNILSAREPENAVTTHPEVVRAVIRELKHIGAHITVGDSPAGLHPWDKLWNTTGIGKVCEEEGVQLIPFENQKTIDFSDGKINIKIPVLKELDSFDAIVSIPKLKTHSLTKITGSVKNSYGLVIGYAKSHFHSIYPSPKKMSSFIGRLYGLLKPDFVIMDAVLSMEGDGPNSGMPFRTGLLFASCDGVALDSCACAVYGYKADEILHIKKASELGFGLSDMSMIDKKGEGFEEIGKVQYKRSKADFLFKIPEKLFFIVTMAIKTRPKFDYDKCVKCGICARICSQRAIYKRREIYKLTSSKCILCMCCIESCPHKALALRTRLFF
ncbi:MAG TPA: hypothetical protein DD381_13845 [Lentisphaeria bacterium]|nr:MAG: hypothetical protein A2X47_13680 [Lentisphaerae bacterium GWF2_38_69]HBM17405.1 hypothetical protein [Lentisphaeria bacterium]